MAVAPISTTKWALLTASHLTHGYLAAFFWHLCPLVGPLSPEPVLWWQVPTWFWMAGFTVSYPIYRVAWLINRGAPQ